MGRVSEEDQVLPVSLMPQGPILEHQALQWIDSLEERMENLVAENVVIKEDLGQENNEEFGSSKIQAKQHSKQRIIQKIRETVARKSSDTRWNPLLQAPRAKYIP